MKKNVLILLVLVGVLSGCEKPKPNPTPQDVIEDIGTGYLSVSDFCYYFNCREAMLDFYRKDTLHVYGWIKEGSSCYPGHFHLIDSIGDDEELAIEVDYSVSTDSSYLSFFNMSMNKKIFITGILEKEMIIGDGGACGWKPLLIVNQMSWIDTVN